MRIASGYSRYTLDRCGTTAGSQNCDNAPESWHAGATVSFDKIAIGGGYMSRNLVDNTVSGQDRERDDFDLGIAYTIEEAWAVGLQYGHTRQDGLDGLDEIFDMYALNGSYALGPGVTIEAQVDYGEFDDDTPGALGNEFVEFMIGTALSF